VRYVDHVCVTSITHRSLARLSKLFHPSYHPFNGGFFSLFFFSYFHWGVPQEKV
jgi:hypothetical protein